MDDLVAIKYKKVKVLDNVYLYVYKGIIENIKSFNPDDNSIYYEKKGDRKVLYEITDPDFNISDEKYGYSDLLSVDVLMEFTEIKDREAALKYFDSECKNFFRMGVVDFENETVKLIHSSKENVINAKDEENYIDFMIEDINSFGEGIFMPMGSINSLIKDLDNSNPKLALAKLNQIKNTLQQMEQNGDEDAKYIVDIEDTEEKPKTIMDELVGLNNVKLEVEKLKRYLNFLNKVKDSTDLDTPNLNMVFKGNPGTGKTTIARIIANILYELGYAKNKKFKETTAQDFIAGYVGQTAIKSRELINSCKGGVILIDEAYVFASSAQQFAQEALVEIIKEMENRDTIFIFAGYKDEMAKFVDMNPGIKSRVGYFMNFDDYSVEELYEIFERKMKKSKMKVTPAVKKEIVKIIEQNKDKERFGNGRFIDQLFDKLIINHAYNFGNAESLKTLRTIRLEDLEGINEQLKDNKVKKKLGF